MTQQIPPLTDEMIEKVRYITDDDWTDFYCQYPDACNFLESRNNKRAFEWVKYHLAKKDVYNPKTIKSLEGLYKMLELCNQA